MTTIATIQAPAAPDLEAEVASLLEELSNVQAELLSVLQAKRQRMATVDVLGMEESQAREQALCVRLEECHRRRAELLATARQQGVPADSLSTLVQRGKRGESARIGERAKELSTQMRLLRHESVTNWVLAQRSLLHVAQLIEIIATGGRMQPTYGEGESVHSRGSLVNQEA